ncbi:MAG: hypothetical protein AAF960_13825 [Bacteroidota bacterium]
MFKFLITGLILYFMYKFMFQPSLKSGAKQPPVKEEEGKEGDIHIRKKDDNPRGEFIDYEEVE